MTEDKVKIERSIFNNGKNLSLPPLQTNSNYNLKEQLLNLTGPNNFEHILEKVNLTIGIVISTLLLLLVLL